MTVVVVGQMRSRVPQWTLAEYHVAICLREGRHIEEVESVNNVYAEILRR
jgi:hypothetical protein